ncbi:E3 ubiquitin ligase family protein [uncultured Chloroflexus sp.]|uniref:E3 ubiquitin ligase family protein n=1 Tax=uncultured Chloroflexus sp. TaxID=214040 RepID=UPI002621541C|nr:E3 ubiquitin ligase family protein [uncultured Chloroflexus sp.]
MVIGGVLLLVLAVIFFSVARANANKLHTLNAVDSYDTATLAAIHQRITAALGASGFAQPCEIEGVIECAAPLVGLVSGQPLVAYTYTVNREYEERVTTTTNGKPETRVERRSEQIEQNERRVPFMVRDERGHVQVLPDGATLELIDTGNRFVEMSQPWTGATRTLGRREYERGLEVGARVFVLGTAIDQGGRVAIARHPAKSKQAFLVSRKSEQELAASAATWARIMHGAAIASGLIGFVLVVWGMLAK